ncbi:hypothetical protein [Nodosilinea sp. E11]|uniref:hypothetical protein n=1 Tax=Nodosilinea sp. E11 TaxID=3037479 RepID=UPI0029348C43|nr:hypothetical protein [Nodosilinea sp. E11]WOD37354.1 hypothetical protein RRF56_02440 [Nodosilinea sp. E11]
MPFVFATNGRDYLNQLETKSGIWFCDLRRPENLRRAIGSWYSPAGLVDSLVNDLEAASDRLEAEPFTYDADSCPAQGAAGRTGWGGLFGNDAAIGLARCHQ